MTTRRSFLRNTLLAPLALPTAVRAGTPVRLPDVTRRLVKPPRLKAGDVVGLVAPASAIYEPVDVEIMEESLAALGLQTRRGSSILNRHGYFAGRDEERAADVNAMFLDDEIDAVFALHGGWGAGRILPLLDYETIAAHPKILLGYSDVTALLLAIHAKTGLITFHGPNGNSTWNAYSVGYIRRTLFDAEEVRMHNPKEKGDNLTQVEDRVRTIRPGTATGPLLGGNLTILSSLVGSIYLPDFDGAILFLEDIGEAVYRVDRMLTQLRLAGILERISGFVFGKCTDCDVDGGYASFTLEEVLRDHIEPLGIPAWHGAMIGHIEDKFTVPVGVRAEIDASEGTITLQEPAVH